MWWIAYYFLVGEQISALPFALMGGGLKLTGWGINKFYDKHIIIHLCIYNLCVVNKLFKEILLVAGGWETDSMEIHNVYV